MNPQLQLMLQQAIQAFRGGNIDGADSILRSVLQGDPKNVTVLHILGGIRAMQSSHQEAIELLQRAIKIDPKDASLYYDLAKVFQDAGANHESLPFHKKAIELAPNNIEALLNYGVSLFRLSMNQEALDILNQVLSINTNFFEAIVNKSVVLKELKQYDEALKFADKALNINSNIPEVWTNRAVALNGLKRYEEAITHYDKALSLKPDYHEAWSNKGVTLHELKRYDEAITHYDKALSLEPDYHEAWSNKGVTLHELKLYEEAITHYDKALSLKPDYAEGWFNKGNTLNGLKRYEEAITHYDKALSLKPGYHEAWTNKGVTLHELKLYEEAITHYDKALGLKPDYHEAWSNKGVTLHELKCFDEAIANYDKALSLKPDFHDASWNKSLSLLLQGDFENGLQLYESRWTSEKASEIAGKRLFDEPAWLGAELLQDKTILLYGEQGLGDFIQFCRYVKLVAGLGANVVLEVPEALTGLMRSLDGISQLVIKGEELPFFDYQCPLLSLPLAFKTNLDTIPNPSRYINLDNYPNKIMEWKVRLGSKLRRRVGLVWSGNPHHKNDHNRSILLRDILPFLPNQCEYVSLQKEVREVDKLTLDSNPHILNFAGHLNDFLDTAALIDNLDLVISVDTSVAHLSAALGKDTWVMLPHVPDWRWLLDREESPWYPSMKLYRQTSIGNWNSVLDRVKSDLNSK